MSENNFTILSATPTPTATPVVGMTNLPASLMGQYCFYDTLNGKPSYKHKDVESYIYWKQGFWNIGIDRNLKGYVAVSSSLSEPPSTSWINIVGSVNFEGSPRSGYADPGSLSDLTVVSMSECPAPTPTPTATPPGFTYPPTSTPTSTPTPTATDIGPSPTPTGTPGSSPTPTPTTHIPAGYLVSGTPLDLKCCGTTGGGGEIHMFWDGFNNPDIAYDEGSGSGSYIMFDDNSIRTAVVTNSEGSKIDHYAIEWIEIHQDDSVHAILSERKQICHYPISNIITRFITIGSPIAGSAATSCSPIHEVECGECKYAESWCLFRINYIQPRFKNLKYFGGLNWEAMKYVSGLSISGSGANGPIGAGVSFYNGPYYRPLTPSVVGAYSTSALDTGNGMSVFGGIISNSVQIDNLKAAGLYDIKDTIVARIALLPQPFTGGSSDPCCSATDLEFTKGNCPKEPTNDWWIIPACNCERFLEDPGYAVGGPFGTEIECYRNTTCGSSFRCVNGECSETYYGYYSTMADCIVNCPYPRPTPPPSPSPTPTPTSDYCTENLNCPYCSITFGGFLYDSDPAGCELVQECCDALGGTVVVVPPPFPGGSNGCRCAFVTPRLPGTGCSSGDPSTADIVLVCDHPEFQQRIIDSYTYNSVNRSGYCCNGYCEPNPCTYSSFMYMSENNEIEY